MNLRLALCLLSPLLFNCASDTEFMPNGDDKSDIFGDGGEGESCSFNWQCSADDELICGEASTCEGTKDPDVCRDPGGMTMNSLSEDQLGNTDEVIVHAGQVNVTAASLTGAVVETSYQIFQPTTKGVFTIAVDQPNLGFYLMARDVGEDYWIPVRANPNRGGERISIFQNVEMNLLNQSSVYEGFNDCLLSRSGAEPIWAYDYYAVEAAQFGDQEVEFRVEVIPTQELQEGVIDYTLTIEQLY